MEDKLTFQVIDWSYLDDEYYNIESVKFGKYFFIELFGIKEDNTRVYLRVENFKPYFYFEIKENWKRKEVDKILEIATNSINYNGDVYYSHYSFIHRKKFLGFRNEKLYKFVKIYFNSYQDLKKYLYFFKNNDLEIGFYKKKKYKLKIYDADIHPMLRFIHLKNLRGYGWVQIDKNKLTNIDILTSYENNFLCDWMDVELYDTDKLLDTIIASFDIECTSSDGNFPLAERDGDEIIQIGICLSKSSSGNCYRKILLTSSQTDNIEDIEVICYKNEIELILGFSKTIRDIAPNFLIGYNITSFDFDYLRNRAIKFNIDLKFSRFSIIKNRISLWNDSVLSTSAIGIEMNKYYTSNGIIIIDLIKVIRKEYKLQLYNLNFVSQYFIRGIIKEAIVIDKKTKFITVPEFLRVNQYISMIYKKKCVEYNLDIYNKLKVLEIGNDYIIVDGVVNLDKYFKKKITVFWCQCKDDMLPRDIFTYASGSSYEKSLIGKYCIQDCVLCNILIYKLRVIIDNSSAANVFNIPLSFLFSRGQTVKVYSLISKFCNNEKYLILNRDLSNLKVNYLGATVFEAKPGIYDVPISVLDFASLYPNSIILKNLSHECFIDKKKYIGLDKYIYHKIEYINDAKEKTISIFVEKKEGGKGIIPRVLTFLIDTRNKFKKIMNEEKDPFLKSILNSKQNAYKIAANAIYGIIGSKFSSLCLQNISASTTSIGRSYLEFSRHFVEKICIDIISNSNKDILNFYKIMLKYYKRYLTHLNLKGVKINLSTTNSHIIESKFTRNRIGYDISKETYDNVNKYFINFQEILFKYKIRTRNYFIKLIEKKSYDLLKKNFPLIIENINILKDLNNEDYKKLLEDIKIVIENLGYIGKREFFNKCYFTFKKLFSNYSLENKVIYGDTDSVFFKTIVIDKLTNKKIIGIESLKISINIGMWSSILISTMLPPPLAQEYEKVLYPFILFEKKNYCGNLYEKNPNKFFQKNSGIQIVRRDNCLIQKKILSDIIDYILNKGTDTKKISEFLRFKIFKIFKGGYKINNFILTKQIKGGGMNNEDLIKEYSKNPKDRFYKNRKSLAHVFLADKITKRDPGNRPMSNDRIPYVYIINKNKSKLQGEFIESPDVVIKNNLEIDYYFYLEKKMKINIIKILSFMYKDPEKEYEKILKTELLKSLGNKTFEDILEEDNKNNIDINDLNMFF